MSRLPTPARGALVRLADALQTTARRLLATQAKASPDELPVVDRRFLRRLKHVEELSRHQLRSLVATIDAFSSRSPDGIAGSL